MPMVKVWAPRPQQVQLVISGERLAMQRDANGWWQVETPLAVHAADYGFSLDGGAPLPDPRSPWQPYGVHGLSRFYDHSRFEWHDGRFSAVPLAAGVVYELHVGTFTPPGTFEAVIEKLDHLLQLGVTHIELMPVAEFPGRAGWGYDGVDLYAPHHGYGGPDGLKRLVDAAHARGLGVLLDVVYNHLGPDGNYLGQYGPYYTTRYATPWGDALNFDGRDSHEVRQFFLDNALHWLRDYHIDGLRLDAIHAMIDLTAFHILEELSVETGALRAQLGRDLALIAESDLNDPRIVRSRDMGGYGLDAQWNDDFRHALWTVLTGEQNGYHADFGSLAGLAYAYQNVFVYDGRRSDYRGRRHGRPANAISRQRFFAYLQNHDQVGNRAAGDRTAQVAGERLARLGALLVFTSPYIPMLFMGEEWGASTPFQYFTDHESEELAQSVRQGRLREFAAYGWDPEDLPDPQAPETPQRSRLDWRELDRQPHAAFLDWHRRLARLRRAHPALAAGDQEPISVDFDERRRWMVIGRELLGEQLLIAANFAAEQQALPLRHAGAQAADPRSSGARRAAGGPADAWERGGWEILVHSEQGARLQDGQLWLPAQSGAVLQRRPAG